VKHRNIHRWNDAGRCNCSFFTLCILFHVARLHTKFIRSCLHYLNGWAGLFQGNHVDWTYYGKKKKVMRKTFGSGLSDFHGSYLSYDLTPSRIGTNKNFILNFMFMWPCIVADFLIIKPTRCISFKNLFWRETLTCFGQFLCPSWGVYSLYTQQWYISYRFVDSFRAGSGWNSGVPSWSCTKAVYKPVWNITLLNVQWINSWWWPEELSEKCIISCQNKFVKLLHLVGYYKVILNCLNLRTKR
jgi:hypothetical protein